MPTPFTHLQAAERLLNDAEVPEAVRQMLQQYRSAYLLGSVVADVRLPSNDRAETHFYRYDEPILDRLWRIMLAQHLALSEALPAEKRAFMAGYVLHLSMDEYWALEMLQPYFVQKEWPDHRESFLMLHVVLTYMDQRDYGLLTPASRDGLQASEPQAWLPFIDDALMRQWRDYIAGQLPPGQSQTLEIFAGRVHRVIPEYLSLFDAPEAIYTQLWQHIPQAALAEVEAGMYAFARAQTLIYLAECPAQGRP